MTPTRPYTVVSLRLQTLKQGEAYHVATAGDHADGAGIELDELADLAGSKVDLDSVVDLDGGIGVADPILRSVRNLF
jgi:hypothetical protein